MDKELETNSMVISVENVKKDVENGTLLLNHPLQRKSQQWSRLQRGNFVRRIICGDHILPLNICTQRDPITNYEYQYLIDGKQRDTTLNDFINGNFAIHAKTANCIIKYSGVRYQTKEVRGKTRLVTRKDKKTGDVHFVPILDERGNKQYGIMEFDIAGIKFSQLPPELQEKVKRYNLPFIIKRNCTDEEIQQEIIDFNSGSAMNTEQKGINLLGVNWAKKLQELSGHPFVLNCCHFTDSEEIKSKVERAIVEALCLTYFDWNKDYFQLCNILVENLAQEHIDEFKRLFDELNDMLKNNEDIEAYITSKEFPIVVSTFHHFKTLNYENKAFGMFLSQWVGSIRYECSIKTEDGYSSYECLYGKGTSSPKSLAIISGRLNVIRTALTQFLRDKCEIFVLHTENEEDDEYEKDNGEEEIENHEENMDETACPDAIEIKTSEPAKLEKFLQELKQTKIASYIPQKDIKELGIKMLMLTSQTPYVDFNTDTYDKFNEWFCECASIDSSEYCILYAEQLADTLDKACVDKSYISADSTPYLIYATKYIDDMDQDDCFEGWLKTNVSALDSLINMHEADSSYIISNCSHISGSIDRYVAERSKTNEIDG